MWVTNNNAAKGAWAFITPFLSFISSNAAGKTLKFAAIGVTNVPQNPAVNANIEHITGSPPEQIRMEDLYQQLLLRMQQMHYPL